MGVTDTKGLTELEERLNQEIRRCMRAERRVRRERDKARRYLDIAPVMLVVVDGDQKVSLINRKGCEVLVYEEKEITGRKWFDSFIPERLRVEARVLFEKLVAGETEPVEHFENAVLCGDGGERIVAWHSTVLGDSGGKTIGILSCGEDITERRGAEERLRQACEEETRARREVEAEMKKRAEFLRALVHELKTPVTAALASSELISSELQEGPLLALAKNLYRSIDGLNNRIDELLDLARGELGMLELRRRAVELLPVLRESFDDMAPAVSGCGQTFVWDVPSYLPRVWADEQRLRQVVMNLLGNASKFTPEGGRITLRARGKGKRLVVEVEDTGLGTSREEQERLFDPYYRVARDRDRLTGLGLGLALCKTLVDQHGGKIWVKSRQGEGSTFGFWVPMAVTGQRKAERGTAGGSQELS